MGQVIPRSAAPETIMEHVDQTLEIARARGEVFKAPAEARLAATHAAVQQVEASLTTALGAAATAHTKLLAADRDSDLTVGAVLDECWNALGRPAQSVEFSLVAGAGKASWTDGDPSVQHQFMQVLAGNFRRSTAELLQARKEEWAKRIEDKAAVQQAAAAEVSTADATVFGVQAQLRGLANLAQVCLGRLKRDYKNQGLTETQIHEIIPDYEPKPRAKPTPPAAPPA
ncbi:MAG: hypothetical protein MUF54_19920 [Polyangiaceae bacterium]|jgi:hypothetical protein|nr:hypothetical protein [Polyangiaceae bacterium]